MKLKTFNYIKKNSRTLIIGDIENKKRMLQKRYSFFIQYFEIERNQTPILSVLIKNRQMGFGQWMKLF